MRSDTRLPLESSPYMAGIYFRQWTGRWGFCQHRRQRSDSYASQYIRIDIYEGFRCTVSYSFPMLQVSVGRRTAGID